jgi:hypothetical protein
MLRWRRDKPVAEANTLQALRALSPSGGEGLEGQSPATASRKLRLFIKCRTGEISIHFSRRRSPFRDAEAAILRCERGVGLFGIGPPILDFRSGSI